MTYENINIYNVNNFGLSKTTALLAYKVAWGFWHQWAGDLTEEEFLSLPHFDEDTISRAVLEKNLHPDLPVGILTPYIPSSDVVEGISGTSRFRWRIERGRCTMEVHRPEGLAFGIHFGLQAYEGGMSEVEIFWGDQEYSERHVFSFERHVLRDFPARQEIMDALIGHSNYTPEEIE